MYNVLVTGGTGFIGYWLCSASPPNGLLKPIGRQAYEDTDLGDQWNYVIHLAPAPVDAAIACARRSAARVLLASSGGVYDREPNDYFRMKLEDERKLSESGLDYRIARIFTTCGARMKWGQYAIGNFIARAEAGEPLEYSLAVRSYLYGSDLAEWLWKILLDGQPGGIYDVGSDVPYSMQEIAHEVASHYNPRPPVVRQGVMDSGPRPYYVPDTTRAREELGLTVKVSFEEAVWQTIKDYRNEH